MAAYTPQENAAIAAIGTYNNNAYNVTTNPGGFDNNGHRINFVPSLQNDIIISGAGLRFGNESLASASLSENWATQTGSIVANGEYSAKEYASGTFVPSGSAKEWSTVLAATVDGAEYSAKEYASGSTVPTGSARSWAVQAANSAATASEDFTASSTTSLTIGNGSRTFAIEPNKGFVIGQIVKAASSANPANEMTGEITAASDGSITVLVTQTGGSGTHADWSISINSVTLNDGATNASEAWSGQRVQTGLNGRAPLVSPSLTGTPTAPTATSGTDDTQIATTEFVTDAISNAPAGISIISTANITSSVAFVDMSIPSSGEYIIDIIGVDVDDFIFVTFSYFSNGTEITTGYLGTYRTINPFREQAVSGSSVATSNTILSASKFPMYSNLNLSITQSSAALTGTIAFTDRTSSAFTSTNAAQNIDTVRVNANGTGNFTSGTIILRRFA